MNISFADQINNYCVWLKCISVILSVNTHICWLEINLKVADTEEVVLINCTGMYLTIETKPI